MDKSVNTTLINVTQQQMKLYNLTQNVTPHIFALTIIIGEEHTNEGTPFVWCV